MMASLQFESVSLVYQPGTPAAVSVFDNLSFQLDFPGHYLICGPVGSGKSSLLQLINQEQKPFRGKIHFPKKFRLAILYQDFLFNFPTFSLSHLSPSFNSLSTSLFSQYWPIEAWIQRDFATLSFSQQKLLAIFFVSLQQPDWILLDEPFSALDDDNSQKLYPIIRELFPSFILFQHQPLPSAQPVCQLTSKLQLFRFPS